MEVDTDGNDRGQRSFTEQEEMEFIAMSRSDTFYEQFAKSIAPQIYGHQGKISFFYQRYQEIHCLSFDGRV